MSVNALMTLLRLRGLAAQLGISRDADSFVRLHFLYAASTTGVLKALGSWTTRADLARQLRVPDTSVLDALLDVGVALGELARAGDRYRLRGKRSAALADERGDALAAILEEYVTYHATVYRDFAGRLADGRPADYLTGKGEMVARSSRILEPFMTKFVRQNVAGKGAIRMLEIGCGSGIYLRHAALANPLATGLGIDLLDDVVREATARLAAWGLDGRFRVLRADIRTPPPELLGPFDLITLYNNIYYFPAGDRAGLLRRLYDRLKPGGVLAITSLFEGRTTAAANFELVLRSTLGCAPMGTVEELVARLHECGPARVAIVRLIPGQPFYGLRSTRDTSAPRRSR